MHLLNLSIPVLGLTVLLMVLIYSLYSFGWARILLSSYLLGGLVGVSLMVLIAVAIGSATVPPSQLFSVPHPSWQESAKWFFAIAWTGYGVEMLASTVAELQDKRLSLLYGVGVILSGGAFVGIPVLVLVLTGGHVPSDDLWASLSPVLESRLGTIGTTLLGLLVISALLYSALAILVPATHTVYQMAHDGLLPAWFGTVNRYGIPLGSLITDITLNLGLLLLFHQSLANLLACANVGYLVVFTLLPLLYWRLLDRCADPLRKGLHKALSLFLFLLNGSVLVIGSYAWGGKTFFLGWLLVVVGLLVHSLASAQRARVILTPLRK